MQKKLFFFSRWLSSEPRHQRIRWSKLWYEVLFLFMGMSVYS